MQLNNIVALLAVFLGVALTGLSAADVHDSPEIVIAASQGQAQADALIERAQRKPAQSR
jgi:hypothetical protein